VGIRSVGTVPGNFLQHAVLYEMNGYRFGGTPQPPVHSLTPPQREALLRSERQQLVADERSCRRCSRTATNQQRAYDEFCRFLAVMFDDIALRE